MSKPVIQSKQTRKKFDKAFKRQAVELWLNSGKEGTEVGAELGIHPQRLSAWRKREAPRLAIGSRKHRAAARERLSAPTTGHFKKNFGHPLRTPDQRFQRIDAMKTDHPIRSLRSEEH